MLPPFADRACPGVLPASARERQSPDRRFAFVGVRPRTLGYLLATRRLGGAVIPSGVSRAFGFARSAGTRSRGIPLGSPLTVYVPNRYGVRSLAFSLFAPLVFAFLSWNRFGLTQVYNSQGCNAKGEIRLSPDLGELQ